MDDEDKYITDAGFHTLVDTLYGLLYNNQFTPKEIESALALARRRNNG